jgi:hypothetical protein
MVDFVFPVLGDNLMFWWPWKTVQVDGSMRRGEIQVNTVVADHGNVDGNSALDNQTVCANRQRVSLHFLYRDALLLLLSFWVEWSIVSTPK